MSGTNNWFNRFNQAWANTGLLDDPSNAQSNAGFAFMGQAPPTIEQFNSLHQWMDRKDNWLYNQIAEVIKDSGVSPLPNDVYQLLNAIRGQQRIRLTSPLTLFIDNQRGEDMTGDGTFANPFRTINRGIWFSQNEIDQSGQVITLQLLTPGVYDPAYAIFPIYGLIAVVGDRSNPRSYTIRNDNGAAVEVNFTSRLQIEGVSLEATGSDIDYATSGHGLSAANAGHIYFRDVAFGRCSLSHIFAITAGYCHTVMAGVPYIIYDGAQVHLCGVGFGIAGNVSAIVTIQNNSQFTNAFAVATNGLVQAWNTVYNGPARGSRFAVSLNGVINTNTARNLTFFPGDTDGAESTGGQYW